MAETTLTDAQLNAIVEETKKRIIASSKSIQDFERITELPEDGSVTIPAVQADGKTKTFDIVSWLRNTTVGPANCLVQVAEDGFYVTDKNMYVGLKLTDSGFDAVGMDQYCKYAQTQEDGVRIVDGSLNIGYNVNTGASSGSGSSGTVPSDNIQYEVLGTI